MLSEKTKSPVRLMYVITQSELGGAQSVVLNLANYFARQAGYEVMIVSGPPGDAWKDLDARIRVLYIKESRKKIGLQDIVVFLKMLRIRWTYRPDVVHLHSSKAGLLGRLVFPRKRIIYTVHGFDSVRLAFRIFLPLEQLFQTWAKYIVGVSHYDVQQMTNEGIRRTICIYNGIPDPMQQQSKSADIQDVTKQLKALKQAGKFIVATIARFSKQKKFDLFCEIAAAYPDALFVWIGNQTAPTGVVPDNVLCAGEVKAAYRLLPLIDLFILTSNYEGLPVSVIEALACGKPVVASNVGGTDEILDGQNGFVLPNQASAFTEKIKQYQTDPSLYRQSCEAARNAYLHYFTIDHMCEEYEKLYSVISD